MAIKAGDSRERQEKVIKRAESLRESEEGAEATSASGPKDLLDKVAWDGVEEEAKHEQQQYKSQSLEDQPAVVVPDEVTK